MHTVGILGMGAMGKRMADRLASTGVDVAVWNRTPVSLPHPTLASPRELAARSTVVVSMLTDVVASYEVWRGPQGALAGLDDQTLAVECSSVTPGWARELSEAAPWFVEAPVVGTLPHVEGGALTAFVGGDISGFERVSDVLSPLGRFVHVGAVGRGAALKLAVNALFASQVVLLGEALDLLENQGWPRDAGLTALQNTPVFAPVMTGIATLMRAGDDDPRFPVRLVEKDLGYASSSSRLLFEAVRHRYETARDAGLGDRNIHAVVAPAQ